MINAWNLAWIIPVAVFMGMIIHGILCGGDDWYE